MLKALRKFSLPCLLMVIAIPAPSLSAADDAPQQSPKTLMEPREYAGTSEATKGQVLKYRLLKPLDFDPAEKYPLVILLHGAGERGNDNTAQLTHGLADFCAADVRKDNPCYVLAPQCPKGEKWADVDWTQAHITKPEKISNSLEMTLAVVDEMLEHAAIDKRRVYITGLSMGGYGTWDALLRRPHFFAAAVPICGGADPSTAELLQHTPIWCFHGGKDGVVSPELSRRMIKALTQAGGEPKYTEYPEAGHDSWSKTYANREVLKWMFRQRLSADKTTSAATTSK